MKIPIHVELKASSGTLSDSTILVEISIQTQAGTPYTKTDCRILVYTTNDNNPDFHRHKTIDNNTGDFKIIHDQRLRPLKFRPNRKYHQRHCHIAQLQRQHERNDHLTQEPKMTNLPPTNVNLPPYEPCDDDDNDNHYDTKHCLRCIKPGNSTEHTSRKFSMKIRPTPR